MSSSKSKSGSTGLRILWIPGRKKHNRKGVYNPTKNSLPQHNPHMQRKNESWTLGGTLNHNKIINADLHDNLDVGMATASGAMSLAAMAANKTVVAPGLENGPTTKNTPAGDAEQPTVDRNDGGAVACNGDDEQIVEFVVLNDLNGDNNKKDIPSSNQFETLEMIDACEDKDRNYSNAESSSSLLSSNNDSRSAEYMHNSATLALSEARRRRRRNSYNNSKKNSCENLDSIDHINDSDDTDAAKIGSSVDEPRLDTFRQSKQKSKKKHRSSTRQGRDVIDGGDDESRSKKDKDDKLVTCLYYSLVCWDCSIS